MCHRFLDARLIIFASLFILAHVSCTQHFSEITISSNLQEGDSISIAFYSDIEKQYHVVNKIVLTKELVEKGEANIVLPDSIIKNIPILSIAVYCLNDSIFTISSIQLKNLGIIYPRELEQKLWWQYGLNFIYDSKQDLIKSKITKNSVGVFPVDISLFYQSRPIGLQLFYRLMFCVSLLLLIAFLFRQTPTQKFLVVSMAFFIATLPLKIDWSNWTLGLMGLASVITFIIAKKRQVYWHSIFWLPVTIFIFIMMGILYAVSKESAYAELDTSVNLVIFPVIFSIFGLDKKNIINLLHFFIRAMMIFCVFGLLSYITIISGFDWNIAFGDSKLYAPLMLMWPALWHPSMVSIILLMAIPVALYLKYEIQKISLFEFLLCMVLMLVFPVLTGARIGIVVAPLLMGMGFIYYSRINTVFKIVLVGVGGLCLFLLINNPVISNKFSDPIRDGLRMTAIDAIESKPFFGWGTGSMKSIIESTETAKRLGFDTPQHFNHFHNQYLDMTVQFGIPGLLLILGLFGWCLYSSYKNKDFILLSFVLLYAFCMMVESPLSGIKGIQPFMFWLCFLVSTQVVRKNRV